MKRGRWFISTGFKSYRDGFWHVLVAIHARWRLDLIEPAMKPGYKRLYVGPLEIEWSRV